MTAALCTLLLMTATVPCLYYAVLFVLGRYRRQAASSGEPLYLTVLIPAHNEADLLPRALRSLAAADYPATHRRVLVVADNCTDTTAEVAKVYGADCFVRTDAARRGKGYALAFGLPHAQAGADAVIVLDADCTVDRDFLRRMSDSLHTADAVQAAVHSGNATATAIGYVAAVGGAVDDAVAAGRDRLGLAVPLRGTGMGFRRAVLDRTPWGGFGLAEDAEYAAALARGGVRVRFAADAHITCDPPANGAAFAVQRRRWTAALRTGPGRWLDSKPLLLAHLLVTAVVVVVVAPSPLDLGWLGLLLAVTAGVYLTAAAPLGRPTLGLLGRAVGVLARLSAVTVSNLRTHHGSWERTPRR